MAVPTTNGQAQPTNDIGPAGGWTFPGNGRANANPTTVAAVEPPTRRRPQ